MAALDRAVALAEVDQIAVAVAEQLHFDVARFDQRLLEDQFVAAKRVQLRSARCAVAPASPRVCTRRMPRPPPPALALIISG
jgi:hypothetical protein